MIMPGCAATGASTWLAPPAKLRLDRDEVHVWRVWLDAQALDLESLGRSLSDDERTRAGRFVFVKDRRAFIATRGLLRRLLAWYLGEDPSRLRFQYGPRGKPALDPAVLPDVCFSVSHSHGLALLAMTRGRNIGIDVEHINDDADCERIATRFFSAQEAGTLRSLPDGLRCAAFFACWARKEAFVKATGEGISRPLDSFEVSCAPHEPAALLSVGGEAQAARMWSVRDLCADPGYAAAVATEGRESRLTCYHWR